VLAQVEVGIEGIGKDSASAGAVSTPVSAGASASGAVVVSCLPLAPSAETPPVEGVAAGAGVGGVSVAPFWIADSGAAAAGCGGVYA